MSEQNQKLSFFEILIAGVMLSFFISWTHSPKALPLIDFYPDFFQFVILPVLSGLSVLLLLFQKKYFKSFLILSFSGLLIVTVFRYSSGYAFRSFFLFVLLFALVMNKSSQKDKRSGAIAIVSSLFIFAAIQKFNSVYWSGSEFLMGSPLMSFVELWFPGSVPSQSTAAVSMLPGLSIFIELLIGIGIVLLPEFFAHLSALFMLAIAFINPPVLSVYFFVLPLLYVIDERFENSLKRKRVIPQWFFPFLLAGLIYFLTPFYRTFDSAFLRLYPALIMFIIMHAYYLKSSIRLKTSFDFKNKFIFITPFLMFIFFIGSYVYFPSPFGFKMFSGKRFHTGYYDLRIQNTEACNESFKHWTIVPVTDSAMFEDESSCHLLFPTRGGVQYAGRYLCLSNRQLSFVLKKSENNGEELLKCSDFQK